MSTVAAFSGGKDSTAMVLRAAELGEDFVMVFTPAGNELPTLEAHIEDIQQRTGKPLHIPENRPLEFWINNENALPSHRMRFCTRLIKIIPCIAYLKALANPVLCVGLRADEEERQGLYGDFATYRYPLREWGWGITDVHRYLAEQRVTVPPRTDCAVCPYQRLGEWWNLWDEYPDEYAQGVAWEDQVSASRGKPCTFRSPGRDQWPASLRELAQEFEAGKVPRGARGNQLELWEDEAPVACRVCRL